jgi:hypothetical protein
MAGRQYQQVAYGLSSPLIAENPTPVIAKRNPTTSDFAFPTTIWTNTLTNAIYILASVSNNQANWVLLEVGGGAGVFASLTVTPGPISLTGTTTINTAGAGVTTIGTGGTGAVNIGNATGNTSVTGTLTASSNITATTGQIVTINGAVTSGNTAASNAAPQFQTLKSRGGGTITTGDGIGNLVFAGFDGAQYTTGAAITSTSSGTIANTRVAANLNFLTHPDAPAGGPTSRMTINSAGNVVVNTPDSGTALTVTAGGLTVTAGNIVATAGNINATAGSMSAGTTVTAGTGITATTGNIVATTGNITATAGNVTLGAAAAAFVFANGIQIVSGTGDPNGAVTAPEGSLYLNTNGTGVANRAYINTNSGTVWTAIATAS